MDKRSTQKGTNKPVFKSIQIRDDAMNLTESTVFVRFIASFLHSSEFTFFSVICALFKLELVFMRVSRGHK